MFSFLYLLLQSDSVDKKIRPYFGSMDTVNSSFTR
uniref:Uncharacterized protein n=1 Tax=Arundo donax TaxID=35708 RepID=A0A0A8ZQT9_ARUDO